ncbi:MAG: SAM-dependent methyltransferase, partial [Catenulispora sp.]|nr:SAM-dependent methyltransferase [Catenulispora sp.]
LRLQDVDTLTETNTYDLIWLPVPFHSDEALTSALPSLHDALRPGGWLIAGTNPAFPTLLRQAVAAWTAHLNGGNFGLTDTVAEELRAVGYTDGPRFPTVPGGPILLAARRES